MVVLRSKCYAFDCGDDSKGNVKGICKSQTKIFKFVEYKNCLDEEEKINECDKYILKSIKLDMYLQKIRKTTLPIFDDKSIYLNDIESLPWK